MRTASMMSSDEIAQETIKQLRADNDALRNSHAAIYLALGTNEADHTKWPQQIAALREEIARITDQRDAARERLDPWRDAAAECAKERCARKELQRWAKELREDVERLTANLNTEKALHRGACDVAGGDPVQAIYALRAEVARLKQRILDDNKAYGCELRDPAGTIWDHAAQLQREVVRLREVLANTEELERYSAGDGHRQWARCGAWLRPDDVVVIISATAIDAAKGGAK